MKGFCQFTTFALVCISLVSHISTPASAMAVLEVRHPWQMALSIGKTSKWDRNYPTMVISPTRIKKRFYSPSNMLEAQRELDLMLPSNYISMATTYSGTSCLKGAPSNIIDIHNALADFGYEAWLTDDQAQFRKFASGIADLSPPNPLTSSEFDRDAGRTIMAWTLCGYYQAKWSSGKVDEKAEEAVLHRELENIRKRWALTPKP